MLEYIPCKQFIGDFLSQPISPKDKALYSNINHKRLLHIIPTISEIIESFICKMSKEDMKIILSKIEANIYELTEELIFYTKQARLRRIKIHSWNLSTALCKYNNPSEIEYINIILKENYVCKNGFENELIGYYLLNVMTQVKEIYDSYSSTDKKTLEEDDTVPLIT